MDKLSENVDAFIYYVLVKFENITGFNYELIKNRVSYRTFSSVKNMKDSVNELAISGSTVKSALSESTWFWQRWFNTQEGNENYKAKLGSAIQENLANIQNTAKDKIKNAIVQNADEFINSLKAAMRECEEENKKLLEEISAKGQLKSAEVAELKGCIEGVKREMDELGKFKNEIETEIK